MLCEKCKKREANTHLTILLNDEGETEHHFCEACYPAVEAERNKTYNTRTPTPLRVDVESITVEQFIEISEKGTRNSADAPAWRQMLEVLSPQTEVRERLTFEAIPLAWKCLSEGKEPPGTALMVVSLWLPKDSQRVAEHTEWLEKMIFKAFELRKALPYAPGKHGVFRMRLLMMLTALSLRDKDRFESIVASLKANGADPKIDERWNVIALVEEKHLARKNSPPPPQNGTNL